MVVLSVRGEPTRRVVKSRLGHAPTYIRPAGSSSSMRPTATRQRSTIWTQPNFHRSRSAHVTLRHGLHVCTGQWMGKILLQVMFASLAAKTPSLGLAVPFERLRFKESVGICPRGISSSRGRLTVPNESPRPTLANFKRRRTDSAGFPVSRTLQIDLSGTNSADASDMPRG